MYIFIVVTLVAILSISSTELKKFQGLIKNIFIFLVFLSLSTNVCSQEIVDSLLGKYDVAKTDREKMHALRALQTQVQGEDSTKLKTLLYVLSHFTHKKDNRAIGYANLEIAEEFSERGDLSVAMKFALEGLTRLDGHKDSVAFASAYSIIGFALASQNRDQALMYFRKALAITKPDRQTNYSSVLDNIATCFKDLKMPDSALIYIQEAVNIDTKHKDTASLAISVGTLGETYMELKQYDVAKAFFRQSIPFAKETNQPQAETYVLADLSQCFLETSSFDSSLFYAREALVYAYPDYQVNMMNAYKLIYQSFDQQKKTDSSNKYYRLCAEIKDSLFSSEKARNIQSMALQEQIRQHDIEAEKEAVATQHRENLENALIAIGIVCFIIFFLLISRSFITSPTLIRFLGIVALLLVFEFFNLLAHPFFERITNHSQILMLVSLAAVAALLVPLHHRAEKWVINKLVEKNRIHRLQMARKTIEKLDPPKES